ncbi:hypothetical protein PSCICO_47640 [Pseudomonas cichorii]|nr:hypothetical protein PSCICO_47640 [Pseudomonas cichorii]
MFGGQIASLVEGEISPQGLDVYELNGRKYEAFIRIGSLDDSGCECRDGHTWVGLKEIEGAPGK